MLTPLLVVTTVLVLLAVAASFLRVEVTLHEHGPRDACASTPDDDAAAAREALAQGDLAHALQHLAPALADDPAHAARRALLDEVLRRADDPLKLLAVPRRGGMYFGTAALRAYALAQATRYDEALATLFQVLQARPASNYLPWAIEWLARPGAAAAVRPETYGSFFVSWWELSEDPEHVARAVPIADAARVHASHGPLTAVRCGLYRRAGDVKGSLDVALEAFEAHPSSASAASVGTALRQLDDLEGAADYFRRGAELDPQDKGVRLDLGDTLLRLDRLDEAAQAYDEVLALDPRHDWALPSRRFVAWSTTGDAAALAALDELARDGNARAQALARIARRAPDDEA